MLAAQLGDGDTGLTFFEHCNDLAFGKSAFLRRSLRTGGGSEILPASVYSEGSLRSHPTVRIIVGDGRKDGSPGGASIVTLSCYAIDDLIV